MAIAHSRRAHLAGLLAAAAIALSLASCGGETRYGWAAVSVPAEPRALAVRLDAADQAWRRGVAEWRSQGGLASAPPQQLTAPAAYVRRAVHVLSDRPGLAAATLRLLPRRLGKETGALAVALRKLHRLSGGGPAPQIRTGPPTPLDQLLRSYRQGRRRFGVGLHVLAAVNLIESAFGRARSASVAGAIGPMQFIPATWRAYGLGGDIRDPHDAVLGAANYLHASGAPASYAQALFAYNRSRLYVDAVLRYARLIAADRSTLFLLYSWPTP